MIFQESCEGETCWITFQDIVFDFLISFLNFATVSDDNMFLYYYTVNMRIESILVRTVVFVC